MDIIPPNGGRLGGASPGLTNTSNPKLSPIEALNLVAGRSYSAKVLGHYLGNEAGNIRSAAEPPNQNEAQTRQGVNQAGHAAQNSTAPANWVLQIQNKAILIETLASLHAGQVLEVRAQRTDPTGSLSLILTPPSSSNSSPLSTAANIEHLIKAMSQSLPRQVSLAAGLETLKQLAAPTQQGPTSESTQAASKTTSSQNPSSEVSRMAASLLSRLEQSIPEAKQFQFSPRPLQTTFVSNKASPGTIETAPTIPGGPAETMHLALKTALHSSGLFFENALLGSKQAVDIFQANLSLEKARVTLEGLIKQTTQASRAEQGAKIVSGKLHSLLDGIESLTRKLESSQTRSAISPSADQILNQIQNLSLSPSTERIKTLDTLQQQIQQVAQQLLPASPDNTANKDLKATLMTLVSTFSDSARPSAARFVDGLIQPELLRSPFQFPHPGESMTASPNLAKAEAILSGQELSTGQVLKLLAGMLNRLQFNQLNSLYQSQTQTGDSNQSQSLFIELPINNPHSSSDVLQLRIDRHERDEPGQKQGKKDTRREWKISLSFDLEGLGKLYVQANLSPPNISTRIWSEQKETLALIQKEQQQFRERLSQLGLEVEELQCYPGRPKTDETQIEQGLVDTRA